MKLLRFFIQPNTVTLYYAQGHSATIFLNTNSGKVYYRYKIDTISKVKHPGIYLGTDTQGIHFFIHNHYEHKAPSIVTMKEFSKGYPLYAVEQPCVNEPEIILNQALRAVIEGKPYESLSHNCQNFVSQVCNNQSHSEDVQKWVGRALLGLVLFFSIKAFNN
jgi:hypothetical protein